MTTKPKCPTPKRAPKRETNGNRKLTPLDPSRPIGKGNPPVETQFADGNKAAVGRNSRPRKLADLQELIKDTLAEEMSITDRDTGRTVRMTRAVAMIRTMLIKSPTDRIALLEYAFGKVPQINLDIYAQLAHDLHLTPEQARQAVDMMANEIAALPEFAEKFGRILIGEVKAESEDEKNVQSL